VSETGEERHSAFIYALCDPTSSLIRYVGKSNDPQQRLRNHIYTATSPSVCLETYSARWIRSILDRGDRPQLVILEETDQDGWPEAERRWIRVLRTAGCELTNATDGGDAGWSQSAETRQKISDAQKGRKQAPHVLEAAHAASRGRVHTEDEKARRNAAIRASHNRPEWKAAKSVQCKEMGQRPPVMFGEDNPRTRLSDAAVVEMRERFQSGERNRDLAERFGVTPASVSQIVRGQTRLAAGGPMFLVQPKRRVDALPEVPK